MTPEATTVGVWVIGLAAVITALLVLGRFVLALVRGARRVGHFFDDWFGEPEREGHPGRPGVVARLSAVEDQVQSIVHEMHPNSGASLRDAVDDIRAQTRQPHPPTVQQTFVSPPPAPGEE